MNYKRRYALGGLREIYAAGGSLTEINAGGTHEENPMGGVPLGPDHSVEEGETIHNDEFVFSDRIKARKDLLKEYNIDKKYAGKTFSEISKKFEDANKHNDFIDSRSSELMLNRLREAQESQKAYDQEKLMMKYGEKLKEREPLSVNATPEAMAETGMNPFNMAYGGYRTPMDQGGPTKKQVREWLESKGVPDNKIQDILSTDSLFQQALGFINQEIQIMGQDSANVEQSSELPSVNSSMITVPEDYFSEDIGELPGIPGKVTGRPLIGTGSPTVTYGDQNMYPPAPGVAEAINYVPNYNTEDMELTGPGIVEPSNVQMKYPNPYPLGGVGSNMDEELQEEYQIARNAVHQDLMDREGMDYMDAMNEANRLMEESGQYLVNYYNTPEKIAEKKGLVLPFDADNNLAIREPQLKTREMEPLGRPPLTIELMDQKGTAQLALDSVLRNSNYTGRIKKDVPDLTKDPNYDLPPPEEGFKIDPSLLEYAPVAYNAIQALRKPRSISAPVVSNNVTARTYDIRPELKMLKDRYATDQGAVRAGTAGNAGLYLSNVGARYGNYSDAQSQVYDQRRKFEDESRTRAELSQNETDRWNKQLQYTAGLQENAYKDQLRDFATTAFTQLGQIGGRENYYDFARDVARKQNPNAVDNVFPEAYGGYLRKKKKYGGYFWKP